MMDKWERVRLGDVSKLISGRDLVPEQYNDQNNGIPYITGASNIDDGCVIINRWTTEPVVLSNPDDILITCKGTVGLTAFNDFGICHLARQIMAIRADTNIVDKKYLKYAVDGSFLKLLRKARSMIPGVSREDILSLTLPLPPLDEQKRIAEVLDKASELIKKRKEQIRLMDQLPKSLFIEMFGDPVGNPMGWDVKTVANVCKKIVGGGTPSKSHPEYFIGDIPWISPKDMKKLIISDSIDHINQNAVENSSTTLVPSESVLMVIRSGILKHTLPVAMSSEVVALNQDMKAFTTNELANPWYLLCFFKAIEPQLLSHVRAVTADNIEYSIIKNHKIPVPPLSLQNEFADRIAVIEQQKAILQNGLAKMETAYKALMQEYFG